MTKSGTIIEIHHKQLIDKQDEIIRHILDNDYFSNYNNINLDNITEEDLGEYITEAIKNIDK